MTGLASLHGGGFRVVLRPRAAGDEQSRQADFFSRDGMANNQSSPITIDIVRTPHGRAFQIGETAAAQIGGLIAGAGYVLSDHLSARDIFRETPIRIYERTLEPTPAADEVLLDRLGRLGEALLVDYGFAPPPPLPTLMAETPAAYTYLGQFLAHEMTVWNPTGLAGPSPTLGVIDSAIDLKTIFLLPLGFPSTLPNHVEKDEGLLLGETIVDSGPNFAGGGLDDLPRMPDGQALLFDPRNDQNLALSQTHVAVTRFAQAALRILQQSTLDEDVIRRIVIRHFQSVVLQDYLTRLVDPKTYDDVMTHGRVWVAPSAMRGSLDPFFVPIEFSAAIFRFGHAMVRDVYAPWNTVNTNNTVDSALASDLLYFTFKGAGLSNGQLVQTWTTDWRHMLGLEGISPIRSTCIGTALSEAVFCLPKDLFQPSLNDRPCLGAQPQNLNLARRTLMEGGLLGLPTGQVLAQAVQSALQNAGSPCQIPILPPEDLDIPDNPAATAIMREGVVGSRFVDQTPLWVYILREASVFGAGNRLGPLGGRIVAETVNAAVEASDTGLIVNGIKQPFAPEPAFGGTSADKFDYSDLVNLAFQGNP